jgi:hypothetical protein
MEAKRFSGSIIGIPEIACPIGSKFSALLCRCGHQQLRDARVRVPQRSKFGGWLTAGAGYVSSYTPFIDCVHHNAHLPPVREAKQVMKQEWFSILILNEAFEK